MNGASRSKKKKVVRCDKDEAGSITKLNDFDTALALLFFILRN